MLRGFPVFNAPMKLRAVLGSGTSTLHLRGPVDRSGERIEIFRSGLILGKSSSSWLQDGMAP